MYVSHNVCLESEGAASMLRILLFRGGNPFLHTGRSSCNFVTMVDGTEEGEGGERRSARMRAMRVRCVNRTNPPHVRWCIGAGARTRWGRESNKEQTVKPKRAKCKNRSERLCSMNFGLIFFFSWLRERKYTRRSKTASTRLSIQVLVTTANEKMQDQISFAASDFRRGVYSRLLTKIRLVVITRMAKPEEVLIVEDENGEKKTKRLD